MRRVWIEIPDAALDKSDDLDVTLHAEGVD